VYKAKDSVEVLTDAGPGAQARLAKDKFFSNSNPTPAQIELRVGAQVMCTQNLSYMKLVNGSRGVVKKFETGEEVLADMERELQEGKLKSYEKDQIDAQKLLVEKDKMYPGG
jgi:ATP-dependent exoDNAse (exonuclease V) alpha subunit